MFTLESDAYAMGPLAVGAGFVFGEASGAVLTDGGLLYSQDLQYASCSPPVIDASEDVFAQEDWPIDGGASAPYGRYQFGLVEIGEDGVTQRREPLGDGYTFALGNAGTIFALSSLPTLACYSDPNQLPSDTAKNYPPPAPILAISSGTSKPLWSINGGFQGPALALTPGASLLVCGSDSVQAFFAGKEGPSTTAPWSRARGSNQNRSCPEAQ